MSRTFLQIICYIYKITEIHLFSNKKSHLLYEIISPNQSTIHQLLPKYQLVIWQAPRLALHVICL